MSGALAVEEVNQGGHVDRDGDIVEEVEAAHKVPQLLFPRSSCLCWGSLLQCSGSPAQHISPFCC